MLQPLCFSSKKKEHQLQIQSQLLLWDVPFMSIKFDIVFILLTSILLPIPY